MSNYDPARLVPFRVNNMYTPQEFEGPRTIPVTLDFTATDEWFVDFTRAQMDGKIETLQTIIVDNSRNPYTLVMECQVTGQRMQFPPLGNYTMPLVAQMPAQVKFTTTQDAGLAPINVQFLNVPMAPSQMGPITVNTTLNLAGSWTDAAVLAIAAANTDQALFAANANRKGMIVQNPTGNITSLWINFAAASTNGSPSIEIPPGGKYEMGTAISTQAVNIQGGTLAMTFTAKELA